MVAILHHNFYAPLNWKSEQWKCLFLFSFLRLFFCIFYIRFPSPLCKVSDQAEINNRKKKTKKKYILGAAKEQRELKQSCLFVDL